MTRAAQGLIGLAVLFAGCAAERRLEAAPDRTPVQWLETATEAHRAADRAVEAGDHDEARRALAGALSTEAPPAISDAHRRMIRQDLRYRLAEVELASGRAAEAARHAEEGLALGHADDVFTANLWLALGRAREATGDDIHAASDYAEALRINDALLRQILAPEEASP